MVSFTSPALSCFALIIVIASDDCFANMATDTRSKADVNLEQARGVGQRAYETVSGAAQMAYGHVVGDESAKQAGHEAYGERQ